MTDSERASANDLLLGHLLRRAYRTHVKAVGASLAPESMTAQSYAVLTALNQQDGLDQTALSKELHVEKAALTATLRQLIQDGYISRSTDTRDSRRQLVFLTKNGREFLNDNSAKLAALFDHAVEGLSEKELEQLVYTLERVISNLHAFLDDQAQDRA